MFHAKKTKQVVKEGNFIMTTEELYIDTDDEYLLDLNHNNYRFDKEGMENMAREAQRVFELYAIKQELDAMEEENYYALSERYREFSTIELVKKIFK